VALEASLSLDQAQKTAPTAPRGLLHVDVSEEGAETFTFVAWVQQSPWCRDGGLNLLSRVMRTAGDCSV